MIMVARVSVRELGAEDWQGRRSCRTWTCTSTSDSEKTTLETVLDYLDQCGADTSEYRTQMNHIQNNQTIFERSDGRSDPMPEPSDFRRSAPMTPPNADSFSFHGDITMNGPGAFGTHATAITGAATSTWHQQLLSQLPSSLWPSRVESRAETSRGRGNPQRASGGTGSLRRELIDRDAVAPKMNRLIAAGLPVKELADAAGRIKDLMRAEFEEETRRPRRVTGSSNKRRARATSIGKT